MLPSVYLYKLVGSAGRMLGATFCLRQCGSCDGRQLQPGPDRQLLGCRLLRWLGMAADQLMRW
jgi:hypothetical protein